MTCRKNPDATADCEHYVCKLYRESQRYKKRPDGKPLAGSSPPSRPVDAAALAVALAKLPKVGCCG